MICLLTAIGLSHGGSSTVHIYTQTLHGTTQITTNTTVEGRTHIRSHIHYDLPSLNTNRGNKFHATNRLFSVNLLFCESTKCSTWVIRLPAYQTTAAKL